MTRTRSVILLMLVWTPGLWAQAGSLSPADYRAIEQLYARNTMAFDSAEQRGEAFAATFTADGVFVSPAGSASGRKALAAVAAKNVPGLHQWVSNLLIESAPNGASGLAYVVRANVSASGEITEGGMYRDDLVKTPDGWRFKRRVYAPGHRMPAPIPVPPGRPVR